MISEPDVVEMKIFFFDFSSLLDNVVGKLNDFIGAFFLGLTAISHTVVWHKVEVHTATPLFCLDPIRL